MRLGTSFLILIAALIALVPSVAHGGPDDERSWQEVFGRMPIQDGGRVMPIETYSMRLAVRLTGRTSWREHKGPEVFAGVPAVELLADLIAKPEAMFDAQLITVDHRRLKEQVGLDQDRKFFSARELMRTGALHALVTEMQEKTETDANYKASLIERKAQEIQNAAMIVATFQRDRQFPLVPRTDSPVFANVGMDTAEPGYQDVQAALRGFAAAHAADGDRIAALSTLKASIDGHAQLPEALAQNVNLEYFYKQHRPWIWAAAANGIAILGLVGFAITRQKFFMALTGLAIAATLAEQLLGLWLRIAILDRAPVSNTYEAVLWMGIVSVVLGLVGQAINRKSMYLGGGLVASLLCIIFSQMVPLTDQTNAIPAVLRSNYWLVIHVMTIVASYGAFLLAAVLGHTYLVRDVVLRRPVNPESRLIVQTYRLIQFGLVLLTIGTILGGVWAAESWGRFWGWDPKETWALISIVLYFLVLHARYVGWIRDFGLAVLSVIGFISIVWTFYGVNYVMGAGLHSYGFGTGGERYVFMWAGLEVAFLGLCFAMKKPAAQVRRERMAAKAEEVEAGSNAPEGTAPTTA